MALALYRKYRPATFGEVVGQEHVTEPLRTALASGRINHAYLFSGPRGCGKTSSARILARSLNCLHGPTAEPCGECDSCVALAPEGSGSVDVIELDAASHGGVDDTRELRDRAVFAPAQSRYRIFVIDEAHMVTPQGFNALLKIVEEPPEHLVFIFATTEPDKVLTTIRSRTHHYPFRLMPPGTMRGLLERVCGEEGVRVEPTVYPLAIRAGGGSARDTLSVFDQLLAGAGDEGITYDRAVALLGVTDVALIDDMVDALAADDGAAVYGTVDRLVEAGHDPRRFASDLLDRLRDLVLLHAVPDAAQRGLVEGAGDELTRMQSQSEQLGAATLSRFAEIVHTGLSEMRGATSPRLLLELLCARMMLPAVSGEETALLQRMERVERRMTIAPPEAGSPEGAGETPDAPSGAVPAEAEGAPGRRVFQRPHERAADQQAVEAAPSAPAQAQASEAAGAVRREPEAAASEKPPEPSEPPEAAQAEPSEPVQAASAPPEAGGQQEAAPPEHAGGEAKAGTTSSDLDAAAVRRVWTELLRAVAERNRPTQALLLNATVQDLRDGTLVLSMPTTGLLKQFAQQHRIEFVRDAMRAVLGGEWQVQCVEAGAQPGGGAQGKRGRSQQAANQPRNQEGAQASARRDEQGQENRPARQASAKWSGAQEPADRPDPSAGAAHDDNGNRAAPAQRPAAPGPQGAPEQRDDVPPPPEPPDEEPPPEEASSPVSDVPPERNGGKQGPDAPFAEPASSAPGPGAPPRDPQVAAVELFASELGAREIDDT